ncbi:MAG: hypothetical protein WCK03_02675, partial [Candidatus Taylorbacteria bacterium]
MTNKYIKDCDDSSPRLGSFKSDTDFTCSNIIVSSTTPTLTLATTPNSITSTQSTTISWSSTNATSCSNNPPSKGGYPVKLPTAWRTTTQPTSGSFILPASIVTSTGLKSLTLYLTCTGPNGSASSNVTVRVATPVTCPAGYICPPPVSTPVQTPAEIQTQTAAQAQSISLAAAQARALVQTQAAAQAQAAADAQTQAVIQARATKPVLYAAGVPGDKNGTVSISGNNITITSLSDGLDWPMLTISWPASIQGGSACTFEGTLV